MLFNKTLVKLRLHPQNSEVLNDKEVSGDKLGLAWVSRDLSSDSSRVTQKAQNECKVFWSALWV